jgi:hypothetical protein
MFTRALSAKLCLALLLAAAGCPSNPGPGLEIVSPAVSELPAGDLTIEVRVSNFRLANHLIEPNVPGEGHLHYFFDFPAPTEPGKPAVAPEGKYAATADQAIPGEMCCRESIDLPWSS